jgi:hypothetical protein
MIPAMNFCDVCGVSMDLHPADMDRVTACGIASRKAELLEAFGSMRRIDGSTP